jgi:hypothetical protein
MGNIKVKGGTPRHGDTLCRSCSNAQIIKGFSASQEIFYCDHLYPKRPLPFAVSECTMYLDKQLDTVDGMEKIAWFLTQKTGRCVGFVNAAKFQELRQEEASAALEHKETNITAE